MSMAQHIAAVLILLSIGSTPLLSLNMSDEMFEFNETNYIDISLLNMLYEPAQVNLTHYPEVNIYVASRDMTINSSNGMSSTWAINLTTRMYCWSSSPNGDYNDSQCRIPGPTLIMKPGQTHLVRLYNHLYGIGKLPDGLKTDTCSASNEKSVWYYYKDPDVTNLHVHGLHVSPEIDDVVHKWVNPRCPTNLNTKNLIDSVGFNCTDTYGNGSYTDYKFEILENHYPGSHWYHAHVHGSVTVQVAGGLAGMINMEPREDLKQFEPVVENGNDHNLVVAWVWLHDNEICWQKINDGRTRKDTSCNESVTDDEGNVYHFVDNRGFTPFNFPIQSLCFINCNSVVEYSSPSKVLQDVLNHTNVSYNIHINPKVFGSLEFKGWIVNGMYQPSMSIGTNEWHRLRIVAANMNYLLWTTYSSWDAETETGTFASENDIQVWLIATDGVYFQTGPRQVWLEPYNSTVVLPPGSRADLMIIAIQPGNYTIVASNDTRADRFPSFNEAPVPFKPQVIMTINASGQPQTQFENYTTCQDWDSDSLPCQPQSYSYSPYLSDTLDPQNSDNLNSLCASNYSTDVMDQCNIVLEKEGISSSKSLSSHCQTSINSIKYSRETPLFTFPTNSTHEWVVTSNFHPFHHHTWPFQLQRNVTDGWLAQRGDWRDTVGAGGSFTVRANYYDFLKGQLVIHCHFVPHEDHGMMQWLNMTDLDSYYKDYPQVVEPITQSSGVYKEDPPELVTSCEEKVERIALAVIHSVDVETEVVLFFKLFRHQGRCYMGIMAINEFRPGGVDNAWIGIGMGGPYKNDVSKVAMRGDGIVWSLQAWDQFRLHKLNVKEINLNNFAMWNDTEFTYTKCNNFTFSDAVESEIAVNQKAYFLCIRPLTDRWLKNINPQKVGFIWSYGEGRFQQNRMHSARGVCQLRFYYNVKINGDTFLSDLFGENTFNYSYCLHKENAIGISGKTDTLNNIISSRIDGYNYSILSAQFLDLLSDLNQSDSNGDNDSDSGSKHEDGLSDGAIIAIAVVCGVLALSLVAVGVFVLLRTKDEKADNELEEFQSPK